MPVEYILFPDEGHGFRKIPNRIKAAVMVQHGANDTNVPVVEAEQIVKVLKERGVPVEYILFPDEGHGFRETFDELVEYCKRVASVVGLMCVEIFGCRGPEAREYAINLGLALQITNIIRDVKDDWAKGRIYLPIEDMRRFGCSDADLASRRPADAVRALLRFECGRARDFYARAAAALPPACARALVAAEIMGGIYLEILRRIEARDYDVFSARVRVPKPVRAVIAMGVWTRNSLGFSGMRLGPAPHA